MGASLACCATLLKVLCPLFPDVVVRRCSRGSEVSRHLGSVVEGEAEGHHLLKAASLAFIIRRVGL